jgi:hypothetical protein
MSTATPSLGGSKDQDEESDGASKQGGRQANGGI